MSKLDEIASLPTICRIYYQERNINSSDDMEYSYFTGEPMGYPELDSHLRKRRIESLEENK